MKRYLIMITLAAMAAWPAGASACSAGKTGAGYPTEASAHHANSGHRAIPGQRIDYLRRMLKEADAIGLNDKQRKQIAALLIDAESRSAHAHAESEVAVAAFRARLHAGAVSDREVDAYVKRMGELRAERLAANLQATVAAGRLLTTEQKSKLYAHKSMGAK